MMITEAGASAPGDPAPGVGTGTTALGAPDLARLHTELGTAHHEIRQLLDRLEAEPTERAVIADELARVVASHRAGCTEAVLRRVAASGEDHELQVRLLLQATRGVDRLADRLRLPSRDPALVSNVLVAFRSLVQEHERLELELVVAVTDAENART